MYAINVYEQPLYVKKEAGKRPYMKTVRQQDLVIPPRVTIKIVSVLCGASWKPWITYYLWANITGRIVSQKIFPFEVILPFIG